MVGGYLVLALGLFTITSQPARGLSCWHGLYFHFFALGGSPLCYNQAQNSQLEEPRQDNKVTLHIILVGVAGTIYDDYTNKPLNSLGLTRQKAKSLATKLSYHAIQSLTPILINTSTSSPGDFWGRFCWARGRRAQKKESPGVQEPGRQSSRSSLALFLNFS
eukprot:1161259-Pelagomonas_calceolata.AAC.3